MARFSRLKVLNTMVGTGVVPVFYDPSIEVSKKVAAACVEGGVPLLEFTNRGDHAWEVFSQLERFCAKELPRLILGVGSIVDPGTASLYINCGANFVVGPVLNPDVARACNRRKVPYSPGCGSASEISQAEELGCEIVKLFPSSAMNGPEFVRSLRGPMPWSRVMPTGSAVRYSEEEVGEWIAAGACALGTGLAVFDPALVAGRQWDAIALRVRTLLKWIRDSRESGRAPLGRPAHEDSPPSGRGG